MFFSATHLDTIINSPKMNELCRTWKATIDNFLDSVPRYYRAATFIGVIPQAPPTKIIPSLYETLFHLTEYKNNPDYLPCLRKFQESLTPLVQNLKALYQPPSVQEQNLIIKLVDINTHINDLIRDGTKQFTIPTLPYTSTHSHRIANSSVTNDATQSSVRSRPSA